MIVDHQALVRGALRRAFADTELKVVAEASSAQEALDAVDEARPDLILLDMDGRGTTGAEVILALRQRAPHARIVVLAKSSVTGDVDDALGNGASGYLTKDISPDALVRAVRGALAGDLAMSRRMAQEFVDRHARIGNGAHGRDPSLATLSARERDILRLLSEGLSAREIGAVLVLSPRTIEGHVGSILRKLGARNRVDAVRLFRGS